MKAHLCPGCVRFGVSCPCPPCDGTAVEQCKEYDPHPMVSVRSYKGIKIADDKKFMSEEERKKQIGGNHYSSHKIQPWDIILDYDLDFWTGNVVKYCLRQKKDKLEDLKKARHYLDERIRQLSSNG